MGNGVNCCHLGETLIPALTLSQWNLGMPVIEGQSRQANETTVSVVSLRAPLLVVSSVIQWS